MPKMLVGGGRLATTKAVLIAAVVGLIACLSITTTTAIAASNNANNVDIQPDKIQVVVNEEAGTINDATFNFVNNSQNYYLFDKTTKMELTSEVEGLTVPEDWDLQLATLNTDLYKGAPNGLDYNVPDEVVTLYPGQSAQATLKFNKGSAELANTLIGKEVFSLTMLPDQYVVGEPQAQTGFTYDGTEHIAIASTEAYNVTTGSATNAGPYQAQVTLNPDYKWPDKSTKILKLDWNISPRIAQFAWSGIGPNIYSGKVQHDSASVTEKVSGDDVSVDEYGFPEDDDGKSAGDHTVFVKSLKGTAKDNYTLEGSWSKYSSYTIDPKPMTITADNKEKAVEDPDPDLTASVDGNVQGEEFVKDEDYELSCQDHPDPKVGDEFAIYVKVKGSSTLAKNYSITTTDGTLVIVDSKPKIVADSKSIVYGQQDVDLTATVTKTEEGHPLVSGSDFTLSRVAGDDAKEYKISITLNTQSDNVQYYQAKRGIALVEGTYTIEKYSVAFTWSEFSGSYTKVAQYPTATLTKAKDDDEVSVKTYSPYDENYDCISAGDQKCKVAELDGADAENYSLDSLTNAKEYKIEKADFQVAPAVLSGNVKKAYNYEDTDLSSKFAISAFRPDDSTLTFSYQWYWTSGTLYTQLNKIEGATDKDYTVEKTSYLGTHYFWLEINVNTTDPNFNNASGLSNNTQYVSLVYMKMTFNDLQTNNTTDLYTHYGTDELYDSETGTTTQEIPSASKAGYVFNGWYTAASEGTQVIDYKNSILKTAVEGYISSNGTWANTNEKTLYAGLYQINYLTFTNEAEGSNEISFKQTVANDCNMNPILIRYSTNATDWEVLEASSSISAPLATLTSSGDKLYVAGYNPGGFSGAGRTDSFSSTGKFSVSGSFGTLIDFTKTSVSEVPNDLCFQSLFAGCTKLTACSNVDLSFTDDTSGCYNHMFKNCTNLKKIQVGFKAWPEAGFDGWVEGLNDDGTCEFICPAELEWKCDGNDFCPKEWHNSKGEAFWTVINGNELHFYAGSEESPENPTRVLLDNTESSPYAAVAGNITSISFTEGFWNWADNLRSFDYWFSNFTALTNLDVSTWPIPSKAINITRTNSMFEGCTNLKKINSGDNDDWSKTGKITSETSVDMFKGDTKISFFDPEKVDISMAKSEIYEGYFTLKSVKLKARSLNNVFDFFVNNELTGGTIYDVPYEAASQGQIPWNTTGQSVSFTSVKSTLTFSKYMYNVNSICGWFNGFNKCRDFSSIYSWDVSNVTDISHCFQNCSEVSNLDLSLWKTDLVKEMNDLFNNCVQLESLNISTWKLTYLIDCHQMFKNCKKLQSVNFRNSDFPKNDLKNMKYMFENCEKLTSITNINSWNTNYVTDMDYMFFNCNSLQQIDINKWNVESATTMTSMFESCSSLKSIYVSDWDTKSLVTASGMFKSCSSLQSLDVANWNVQKLESARSMFENCSSLRSIDINNWNVQCLKDAGYMFSGCTTLKDVDLAGDGWKNAQNLENINRMFQNCTGFDTSFVAESWNFPKMTNAEGLFYGCSNVNQIVLTRVYWPACTNMNRMFFGCKSLLVFNFQFNNTPSAIADLGYAFYGCEKLQIVGNIGSLTMTSCKNVDYMFNGCKALTEIQSKSDTDWSKISGIGEGTDMFAGCENLPGFSSENVGISMAKPTTKGGYFTPPTSDSSQELNDDLQTIQDNEVAEDELDNESQTDEPKPESKDPESLDPDPVAPDPKKEEDKEAIDPVKPEEVYIEEVIE